MVTLAARSGRQEPIAGLQNFWGATSQYIPNDLSTDELTNQGPPCPFAVVAQ